MAVGVWVACDVGVAVIVGVRLGVGVAVPVDVGLGVDDGITVAEAVAIGGQGPVLPTMIRPVRARVAADGDLAVSARAAITAALDLNLEKGEAFVCHVAGSGAEAKVVAVERIPT